MSILEDLYSGRIYPCEIILPKDEKYRETNDKIEEMRDYFEGKLSPEDKEKFAQWNQLIHESEFMNAYENFAYGFRLGVALIFETLAEYEPPRT